MRAVWLLAAALYACAPTLPAGYVRARDSAERAYASGQFSQAGARWLEAAQSADRARDRSEARYRAATSYQRAGDIERARELYTLLSNGKSERAARATFALADLRLSSGDLAGGKLALEAAIRRYPSSGVAGLALRRYFALLEAEGGQRAVLDYIQAALPTLGSGDLGEQLLYERARRLEVQGKIPEARDAYLTLADRFPYPYGAYWDDALFRAADLEVKLGDGSRAIALLQRMLRARETSHLSGSYERPRFAEAAYRLAELYRDQKRDPGAARRAFHAVFVDYPTSTLRDDALWHEALLFDRSESERTCAPLTLLVQQMPESRYAACAHELCPSIALDSKRECAGYIQRELGSPSSERPTERAD